ncbi:Uma2 family endonuclease [Calothrix sp. UHCC 0171]|uniref:Uma2 family endonuclease n=1 Tax=Calothrix sp. UHCC 0171 TaxID=3110245 RepID=UPI002B1F2539|nr:Uma2 family endonuclease [Calothrix sp. UHCC 0171]MEA5573183.1 Uma2 family endonuclease [Calothrix sp. UHCC 0171]
MVSSLKELIEEPGLVNAEDPEAKFTSSGVSWQAYETLLVKLADNSHYRITYLDGVLEIVSPSKKYETIKSRLAILIALYLIRKRIKNLPMGSTTFKNSFHKVGVEPDECYCIGEEKDIPDLAVEVNITSGSISKLETYRRLGVAEIWFWERNELKLYHLRNNSQQEQAIVFPETYGYEQIAKSEVLPQLDISLLIKCALIPDSVTACLEFEQGIT